MDRRSSCASAWEPTKPVGGPPDGELTMSQSRMRPVRRQRPLRHPRQLRRQPRRQHLRLTPSPTPTPTPPCYEQSTPPFNFTEINTTGTVIPLDDDQVSGAIPLGFTFSYFGISYTNVYVSSNGFLTVLPGQDNGCCSGQPLPSAGNPNGVIAPLWRDLYPPGGGAGGGVFYQTLGAPGSRVFIAEYKNVPNCCSGAGSTVQIKLFEGTNAIEFHYVHTITYFGNTSAGIENQTGTIGYQFFFGQPGTVPDNTAVRYEPGPVPCPTPTPNANPYANANANPDADTNAYAYANPYTYAYRLPARELRWRDRSGTTRRLGGDKLLKVIPPGLRQRPVVLTSPPNALGFARPERSVSDKIIETPGFIITSAATQLIFHHSYDMELSDAAYDGKRAGSFLAQHQWWRLHRYYRSSCWGQFCHRRLRRNALRWLGEPD